MAVLQGRKRMPCDQAQGPKHGEASGCSDGAPVLYICGTFPGSVLCLCYGYLGVCLCSGAVSDSSVSTASTLVICKWVSKSMHTCPVDFTEGETGSKGRVKLGHQAT